MAYPTLQRDPAQDRRRAYDYALLHQREAKAYAECAASARDEGWNGYACIYQDRAASHARAAANCVAELIGVPRSYDA